MKTFRIVAAIIAVLAGASLAGCSSAGSAVQNALSFSGTFTGSYIFSPGTTSILTIDIEKGGNISGSITNCPSPGSTYTFTGSAKLNSVTSGSATIHITTTNAQGQTTGTSTAYIEFSYSSGAVNVSITDSAIGSTVNITAT